MKIDGEDSSLEQSFSEIDALLADLQSTIPGSGNLNTSRSSRQSPLESPVSKTDSYHVKTSSYGKTKGPNDSRSPSFGQSANSYSPSAEQGRKPGPYNNNLLELDNLLQDLSSSRYANISENGMNGTMNSSFNGSGGRSPHSRPSSAQSISNRPTVDSLLDSLDAG
ncbi:hypothetical protein HHI36_007071 [Cryptolaemus montrouzieri]|uniref:Paxillin n=1 Tax=Cryptolaemus montrouzieri TaxID=559131 RepID=A0ABD2MNL1_9CUCU